MIFEITARDPASRARCGLLHTPHGVVETPAFMPVGTAGTIKGLTQDQLERLGVQILLANTYHLYLRPGHEIVREAGGLHRFMSWPHPILTDSGGFQVMSLRELRRVTEDGVCFRSHLNGSSHYLPPERAIEIQLALGADIIMILDQCIEYPSSYEATLRAVELTARWARRAKEYYAVPRHAADVVARGGRLQTPSPGSGNTEHVPCRAALFGIVQGGIEKNLRLQSAEEIINIGFEGYAVGGLAVGEPKEEMYQMAEYTADLLPVECPRYLMGVGTPRDLVECVSHGIDMFDCVLPTRNARNAMAFTSEGKVAIKNARYARDEKPLDPKCACPTCARYSRRYLRHLFHAGEMLGPILATQHNVYFYLDSMHRIREAIRSGTFERLLYRVRAGDPDGVPSSLSRIPPQAKDTTNMV